MHSSANTIFRAFGVNFSMRKRNTLRLWEGFEKKGNSANRTMDTIKKIRLVLQLLLANTLIHVIKKSSKYEQVQGKKSEW